MLDEGMKKDLLEMAASQSLRRDFEIMRDNAKPRKPKEMDIDLLLGFLTAASRLFGRPLKPRRHDPYARPLI